MSSGIAGKYRVEQRLGGGGMAEVFAGSAAGAEGFSRKVAIKRVLPGFSDDAAFARMFAAEAQISAQLIHPNIVSVLDFDRDDDGRLFLVMELVDGVSLDALLATGLLPLPVVIFVIAEALRGLGFAHDLPTGSDMRGVVHRDVSPHNVLLSWEGAVKVSDFGIAKARAASEASASVFIKGKPAYMSPEQANGQRLDGRSDLFAVGVVLWEMLVGQRLFTADDTRAILAAVLFGKIPRPRSQRSDVPRDLERVTMKLLQRDLPARYATAEAAIADLMHCADAPRAGREAVTAVLIERFPDRAPVRHSAARARSAGATPTPVPGSVTSSTRSTLTGVPEGPNPFPAPSPPAAPSASALDTHLSAPTGPLPPPPRRWLRLGLLAAALLVASGGASFTLVSLVRQFSATASTDVSPSRDGAAARPDVPRSSDTASTRERPRAADDASFAPAAAAPPIDAGATDAPKPDAIAVQSAHPSSQPATGSLHIVGVPILTVTVDGKPYGDTPLTIPLNAGRHRVQLQNVENHSHELLSVTIVDHQTFTIDRMPQ
jgi:serine/threonine protein kinase